ncbi:LysR family transcriptional regulator [Skermanella stibiiresistens SB22]|uniref:LysR family transcriptional regulator n=1 Tax=Skermanella stibiiresistens SB22 TaxID=1385369 RepID=W9H7G6_9PROT|nr:LysR family transcriptional regulator [Skermanella stibiiresistens]EWY39738.1 LysR family transcriptional regulator [Skermanella stibiiresistens SB22]
MELSLSDLTLFTRTAALGNISAAGRELGLAPASASQRLQAIEREIGARLFHRTTRKVALNEDGRVFLAYAQKILADAEEARDAVTGAQSPAGTLSITAPASFGRQYVSPILPDFMKEHPKLKVRLLLMDHVIDIVSEGIDVAIRVGALPDSSLVAKRLVPNQRVLCAAPAYLAAHGTPDQPSDLERHACLVLGDQRVWRFDSPGALNRLPLGEVAVRVTGPLESNHGEVIKDAALAGLGIAIKSTWDVAAALRDGRLVAVLTDHPLAGDSAIWAVYPNARLLPARVRLFVDFIDRRFGHPTPFWDDSDYTEGPS